jgi:hypothetical protein
MIRDTPDNPAVVYRERSRRYVRSLETPVRRLTLRVPSMENAQPQRQFS